MGVKIIRFIRREGYTSLDDYAVDCKKNILLEFFVMCMFWGNTITTQDMVMYLDCFQDPYFEELGVINLNLKEDQYTMPDAVNIILIPDKIHPKRTHYWKDQQLFKLPLV